MTHGGSSPSHRTKKKEKSMCIEKINKKKTLELKASKEPIIAYKLLTTTNNSLLQPYFWSYGLNLSSRNHNWISLFELKKSEVHKGFHFFLERPQKCPYAIKNRDQLFLCENRYKYECRLLYPSRNNILVKFEIEPNDIVVVGKGTLGTLDIVSSKAKMLKE